MKNLVICVVFLSYFSIIPSHLHAQWVQTNIPPSDGSIRCFAIVSNGAGGSILFAGASYRGVYRSLDYGKSWSQTFIKVYVNRMGVNGSSVFAGTAGDLYRTTDFGTTWDSLSLGLFGWGIEAIAAYPDGAGGTNMFAGMATGLFISTDNGAWWKGLGRGMSSTYTHSFAMIVEKSGVRNLFAGTEKGIFVSTNDGTYWYDANDSMTRSSVWAIGVLEKEPSTKLFASIQQKLFVSTNLGSEWKIVNTGVSNAAIMSLAIGGNRIFAGTYGSGVLESSDGGESWYHVSTGLPDTVVLSVAVCPDGAGGTNLIAGTYDHGAWLHRLGYLVASRWNLVSPPMKSGNRSKGYLFAGAVSEAYSYQGSYTPQESLEVGRGYWLKFDQPQYVDLRGDSVFTDSIEVQEGWNLVGSITLPVLTSNIGSDQGDMRTSTFFSYDRGYHIADTLQPARGYWVKVNMPGKLILSATPLAASAQRIQIIRTGELPPSPPSELLATPPKLPSNYSLSSNYPNPFNPVTRIEYSLPLQSHVRLAIYDVLGRVIVNLVETVQEGGYKVAEWNASSITSGIYFYRLDATSLSNPADRFSETRKMVLIK